MTRNPDVLRELTSIIAKLKSFTSQSSICHLELQRNRLALNGILEEMWDTEGILRIWQDEPHQLNGLLSLLASGRIASVTSHIDSLLKAAGRSLYSDWISDGSLYSRWLGKGVIAIVIAASSEGSLSLLQAAGCLLSRSLSFGYPNDLIESMLFDSNGLVYEHETNVQVMFEGIAAPNKRRMLLAVLSILRTKILAQPNLAENTITEGLTSSDFVSGCAAVIALVIDGLQDELDITSIFSGILHSTVDCIILLRAVVIAAPRKICNLLLEKSWQTFSDMLSISHMPIPFQHTIAQLICLCIGKTLIENKTQIYLLARSDMHARAISSRLKSSSAEIRFLGMALGVIVSSLVDGDHSKLAFEFNHQEQQDLKELQKLVDTEFINASIKNVSLLTRVATECKTVPFSGGRLLPRITSKHSIRDFISQQQENPHKTTTSHTKQAPEGTLVSEEPDVPSMKGSPKIGPTYVRDLLSALKDTEDQERFKKALSTASALIRQKAGFGFELRDHAQELALVIVNLKNSHNLADFEIYCVNALKTILLAQLDEAGQTICQAYFSRTLTVVQKLRVLESIALTARHLSGTSSDETYWITKADGLAEHALSGRAIQEDHIGSRFSEKVANALFHPFMALQHRESRNGSHESSFLSEPMLRTMTILYITCRSSSSFQRATEEFWDLLLSNRRNAAKNQDVLETITMGLGAVVDSMNEAGLVRQAYQKQLTETMNWMTEVLQKGHPVQHEFNNHRSIASMVLMKIHSLIRN